MVTRILVIRISSEKGVESVFLWTMYDLETHAFFVSRDVVFHENVFPFAATVSENRELTLQTMDPALFCDDDFLDIRPAGASTQDALDVRGSSEMSVATPSVPHDETLMQPSSPAVETNESELGRG